jgi:GNAT superfamily N-acetyltransferase
VIAAAQVAPCAMPTLADSCDLLSIAEFDEDRDLETFVRLHRRIYPEQTISVEGFRAAAPVRRGRFWVTVIGRTGDQPVGFARAMTNPFDPSSIDVMLGVDPELRRRGYGSALLKPRASFADSISALARASSVTITEEEYFAETARLEELRAELELTTAPAPTRRLDDFAELIVSPGRSHIQNA